MVSEGFLKGNTIEEVLETYLGDLVGDGVYDRYRNQFPLLVKLLDIKDRLSVQVHPDDATAMQRYDSYGKKECWYVLEAGEDAVIYLGFRKDVTAGELYEACKQGTADRLLNVFHPKKGECYIINPGTVHAAGGGLVIAEIQEPSDVTLRLYDWGRENDPATAREMNLEEALDIIDYKQCKPEDCVVLNPVAGKAFCDNDKFTLTKITLSAPYKVEPEKYDSFIIYLCTEGSAELQAPRSDGSNSLYRISKGQLVLVPAAAEECILVPATEGTELIEACITNSDAEHDDYIDN